MLRLQSTSRAGARVSVRRLYTITQLRDDDDLDQSIIVEVVRSGQISEQFGGTSHCINRYPRGDGQSRTIFKDCDQHLKMPPGQDFSELGQWEFGKDYLL